MGGYRTPYVGRLPHTVCREATAHRWYMGGYRTQVVYGRLPLSWCIREATALMVYTGGYRTLLGREGGYRISWERGRLPHQLGEREATYPLWYTHHGVPSPLTTVYTPPVSPGLIRGLIPV